MKRRTIQETVAEYLTKVERVRERPCRSRKYRQFDHPYMPQEFLFVGKAGAVRSGRTATGSASVTHIYQKAALEWARKGGAA